MTNLEKYNQAFIEVFAVESSALNENFNKDTVEEWDSVHPKKGKEILRKYEVEL